MMATLIGLTNLLTFSEQMLKLRPLKVIRSCTFRLGTFINSVFDDVLIRDRYGWTTPSLAGLKSCDLLGEIFLTVTLTSASMWYAPDLHNFDFRTMPAM